MNEFPIKSQTTENVSVSVNSNLTLSKPCKKYKQSRTNAVVKYTYTAILILEMNDGVMEGFRSPKIAFIIAVIYPKSRRSLVMSVRHMYVLI
jgi:hypothetical protein